MSEDILRTHRHLCLDCEIVNALFDESASSNLQMEPRALTQLLEHIHRTPEIAVTITPADFTVKSHVTVGMSTAIALAIEEFELFDIKHEHTVALVFTFKELKALLALCEACDSSSFMFYYCDSGQPVKCVAHQIASFSVQLVIATLERQAEKQNTDVEMSGTKRSYEAVEPVGRQSAKSSSSSVNSGQKSSESRLRRMILDDEDNSQEN